MLSADALDEADLAIRMLEKSGRFKFLPNELRQLAAGRQSKHAYVIKPGAGPRSWLAGRPGSLRPVLVSAEAVHSLWRLLEEPGGIEGTDRDAERIRRLVGKVPGLAQFIRVRQRGGMVTLCQPVPPDVSLEVNLREFCVD